MGGTGESYLVTFDIAYVFGTLLIAIVLFVTEKIRPDMVGLLLILALFANGAISLDETFAGFSDPLFIMIAGLLVVGEGLMKTGLAARLGSLPQKVAGDNPTGILLVLMSVVAFLSAFMSSTGAVALMIPVALTISRTSGIPRAQLMMPMALATMVGGMLTLIGTPPNLAAATVLEEQGIRLSFFSPTPVALVLLATSFIYVITLGRKLLPQVDSETVTERTTREITESWGVAEQLFHLEIEASSPLVGLPFNASKLRSRFNVDVVEIIRKPPRTAPLATRHFNAEPDFVFQEGDILVVRCSESKLDEVLRHKSLTLTEIGSSSNPSSPLPETTGVVEVMLTARSRLLGRTLQEFNFRNLYKVNALAVRRLDAPLKGNFAKTPLKFGDTILVEGPWDRLQILQGQTRDFVIAEAPEELASAPPRIEKAVPALLIILALLLVMTITEVPHAISVTAAAVAMVLSGSITMEEAYGSLHWKSLVLIAAVLPVSTALTNTGGMEFIVSKLGSMFTDISPIIVLFSMLLVTSMLSQVISNTATAILFAPVASQTALALGLSPLPFVMGVGLAASTALLTPIGSPINLLVMAPGGYQFRDYLRVGTPLQAILLVVCTLTVPVFFPFHS